MTARLRGLGICCLVLTCVLELGELGHELLAQDAVDTPLRVDLANLESKARELARLETGLADTLGPAHPERIGVRNELTHVVSQIFAIKQSLMRDDVDRLRRRLTDLERTIAARDLQAQSQIASRVRGLLREVTAGETASKSTSPNLTAPSPTVDRVLVQKHVAKLKELCDTAGELFIGGRGSVEPCLSARRERFEVESSLAVTPEERLAIARTWVLDLAQLQQLVHTRFENGVADALTLALVETEVNRAERVLAPLLPTSDRAPNAEMGQTPSKDRSLAQAYSNVLHDLYEARRALFLGGVEFIEPVLNARRARAEADLKSSNSPADHKLVIDAWLSDLRALEQASRAVPGNQSNKHLLDAEIKRAEAMLHERAPVVPAGGDKPEPEPITPSCG